MTSVAEFREAKRLLHTSIPKELVCREGQVEEVYNFLSTHLSQRYPGSMYIAGAPGTGKTAVVEHVIRRLEEESNYMNEGDSDDDDEEKEIENKNSAEFNYVFVNCMDHNTENKVYTSIYKQLNLNKSESNDPKGAVLKRFTSKLAKNAKMIILVLDEIDQLIGKSSDTLKTIFEFTNNPKGKLIVIGIANALDLAVRHFQILEGRSMRSPAKSPNAKTQFRTPVKNQNQSKKNDDEIFKPEGCHLMSFPAYDKSEIETILIKRLNESRVNEIFNPGAIKFVAAKVAATTGDMRKALNGCKMALDKVQIDDRKSSSEDSNSPQPSPKRICTIDRIGIPAVAKIFSVQKDQGQLPLQQKMILSTLLRINKKSQYLKNIPNDGVKSAISINSLYDEYRKVCDTLGASWIERSEILEMCGLLEDRSLLNISDIKSKLGNMKKFGSNCGASSPMKSKGIYFDPRTIELAIGNNEFLQRVLDIN